MRVRSSRLLADGSYGTQDNGHQVDRLGRCGDDSTRTRAGDSSGSACLASPADHAGGDPTVIRDAQPVSSMLPSLGRGGMRTLNQIYADVSLLSRIDSKNFFLSDFSQQLTISPLIESASSGCSPWRRGRRSPTHPPTHATSASSYSSATPYVALAAEDW